MGVFDMIEIAESQVYAKQLKKQLAGKTIVDLKVLTSPHKFCWFSKDPQSYEDILLGSIITDVISSAHYIRIIFSSGHELALAEDVTYAYTQKEDITHKNQLVLIFEDDYALELKVKLYGFMLLGTHEELKSQFSYYEVAVNSIHPLDQAFTYEHFLNVTHLNEEKGSVKSVLATEQHIPGLGNGTLQDILFDAKLSPKRKVNTLSEDDKKTLYQSVIKKIDEMITFGGRDQVLSIFGEKGSYEVLMKNDRELCPICQTPLKKEAFLGGKVIYCPICQK
jgi:formamidopyrimidine-DNA glycosylase